MKHSIRFTQVT